MAIFSLSSFLPPPSSCHSSPSCEGMAVHTTRRCCSCRPRCQNSWWLLLLSLCLNFADRFCTAPNVLSRLVSPRLLHKPESLSLFLGVSSLYWPPSMCEERVISQIGRWRRRWWWWWWSHFCFHGGWRRKGLPLLFLRVVFFLSLSLPSTTRWSLCICVRCHVRLSHCLEKQESFPNPFLPDKCFSV